MPSRATHLVEPTFCFSCKQFTAFRKGNVWKVGSPSRARLGNLFKYISFCFILLFTSSSPCRKDQFAVSYFSTSLIVLIQVYNWEIRHHSLVCCCRLADILYILELGYRLVTVLPGTTFLPINGAKPAFICSWITLVFHEAQSVREAVWEFNGPIKLLARKHVAKGILISRKMAQVDVIVISDENVICLGQSDPHSMWFWWKRKNYNGEQWKRLAYALQMGTW